MNVVDSSLWLEYFANGPLAAWGAPVIETPDHLVIPAISLFEVFKRIVQQRDEHDALLAVAAMQQGTVVPLDADLALAAARLAVEEHLPMADSIILATARATEATLWTCDADFEGLKGVRYKRKK